MRQTIDDPQTGQPFECGNGNGYCIPVDPISRQAVNLLSLLPPPNFGSASAVASNYRVVGSEGYNDDNFVVRVDDNLTRKLHLLGRLSLGRLSHCQSWRVWLDWWTRVLDPMVLMVKAGPETTVLSAGFDLHTQF